MTRLKNLKLARPIIFFDIESTGTNPQVDRIIEICVAKLMPGGEFEVKSRRVNPERPIPTEAIAIHGIKDEDVANEPTFAQVSASLNLYFQDCDIGGYNINKFDIPILCNEFKRVGMNFSIDDRRIIDVQTIFHKMEPRTLAAAFKFFCGKELENAHAAESDVLATIAVFDAELERYPELPKDINKLHEFCNPIEPGRIDNAGKFKWNDNNEAIIAFGKNKGLTLKEIATSNPGFLSWIIRSDFQEDAKTIAKEALAGKFPRKNADKK